eukprot:gnl/MRDRNA2_/MRDRNA2_75046_c0_seq1.p1 gnl/MRDRNA2_/MRDRNA2_75046_c0~~gnl/MRDRNA2_/MRDRNA2_75046_c0_seq1.p1  ORF type:complete len:433 (+),score=80.91 gnl/MRDRNA2_/MRDRNA2_75046_c0_seq1:69-1367(+)
MPAAQEKFGEQIPFCEPYWYHGYHSPYYRQSHVELRAKVRKMVEEELKPHLDEWIASPKGYPLTTHERCYELGLPTVGLSKSLISAYPEHMVPKDGGWDAFHELVYLDEAARLPGGGCLGQIGINSMALPPVVVAGTPDMQEFCSQPVIQGKKNISLAISEPTAGSDVANIKTTAVLDGDHYVVNGQKKWITGGHIADYCTLAVRTGPQGMGGISLLLVDMKSPGLSIRKLPMQFDSCHGTTFLTFEDVRVPKNRLIGQEGGGFMYLMLNFNHERFVIAASTCRYARLCYEESMKYALKRKTFGKALVEHGIIRWKLAEMARLVEALYDNAERIAYQYTQGIADNQLGGQCAMLKVNASKTFEYCAREASQIFGGSSLVKEGQGKNIERLYREVRAQAIPGGSEEVMLDFTIRQAIGKAKKLEDAASAKSKL